MIKTIIILRHGETTKDKNNPQRGLTKLGKKQMEVAGLKIKKIVGSQKAVVITANTKRARQSAIILVKCLKIPLSKKRPNLRITNIEKLKKFSIMYPKASLTQIYFKLFKTKKLPDFVEKPDIIVSRFIKVINLMKFFSIVIIVSHAGAIEAFVKFQNKYKVKKIINNEITYGKFIILERKSN